MVVNVRFNCLLLTVYCLLVFGCAPPANREELAKEVLKVDPEFSSVLEKHRELSNRLETYEHELALKRSTVEQAIAQLRNDLAATSAMVKTKTAETKRRMEPEQKRFELELSMASEQLKALRSQRAMLGHSMAALRKATKSNTGAWTETERANQQAQLDELLRETTRLDREMAGVKEHVRLLKIKLLLIKL